MHKIIADLLVYRRHVLELCCLDCAHDGFACERVLFCLDCALDAEVVRLGGLLPNVFYESRRLLPPSNIRALVCTAAVPQFR